MIVSSSNMSRYFTSDLWAMTRRRSTLSRLTPSIRSEINGFLAINFAWSISQSWYIHQIHANPPPPTPTQSTTHTTKTKKKNRQSVGIDLKHFGGSLKEKNFEWHHAGITPAIRGRPSHLGIVYWGHFPSRTWEKPEMSYGQMAHAAMPHQK